MSVHFALDPSLEADTHAIGELAFSQLLLMDDARFPWLILVPRICGARELIDLDEGDQRSLIGEISLVGRVLETLLRPDKLNVAALGNVVPQLHVHMIARYTNDAAWPKPVWGVGERVAYADEARLSRIAQLRTALHSHLA
jgi:diadenosine tetraphosphate (Ap4A) HIT family hydrolase